MRKHRYYLGKRHINHTRLRAGDFSQAPRFLRAFYELTYRLRLHANNLKLGMNGSYGARGIIPVRTAEDYHALLAARQTAVLAGANRLPFKTTKEILDRLLPNNAA